MEDFSEFIKGYGITADEACKAIMNLPKIPFSELDIMLINSNPSLSYIQKKRMIRFIKNSTSIK